MVEYIIKKNQIFNNVVLTSKLHIIKVFPELDMAIIWVDIWDVQSRSKVRGLINRCFNIGSYIATIRGANINPGISQCKNCWKWGHTTFSYRIQGAKYIKYNGSHKSKHHQYFAWCCKANKITNPPKFETKKGKLCPYSFKCSNC